MNPAVMRLGSLEILAAVAAFGFVTAQLRPRGGESVAGALDLRLAVREGATSACVRRNLTVTQQEPVVIGRSAQVQLVLGDPEVSRRHARLHLSRGVLYLADAGSSNGTFLNGKSVGDESIELRVGDDIDVGNTRITLESMDRVR